MVSKSRQSGLTYSAVLRRDALPRWLGVKKDAKQAFEWYQKAAIQGESVAQYALSRLYQQGVGVTQDDRQAFKWAEPAANHGVFAAQHYLATSYLSGKGVAQDYQQAKAWFAKACSNGMEQSCIEYNKLK